MLSVTTPSIGSATPAAPLPASTPARTPAMGEQFMTLLITQLKNQDPLKPLENAELTSQLAQINTVDGIENLNKTLTSITGQIGAGQRLQAMALIGHGVLVPGDEVFVGAGQSTPFGLELEAPADSVRLALLDSEGKTVRTFDLGAQDAGAQSFAWDGAIDGGGTAADGAYRLVIDAQRDAAPVAASALTYAQVAGVVTLGDTLALDVGPARGKVAFEDIRHIF